MPRLLALPLMAVVIGVLACGTTAAEVVPQAPPPIQSPTEASASKAGTESSFAAVSSSTPVPASSPSPEPTVAPALTPPSDSAAIPASTPLPDTTTIPTSTPQPSPTPEPTPVPTEPPPRVAVIVEQPEVGTGVGKTLPHFEFTLIDGTKRSTAQLSSRGQPVFLFFFATW